MEEQIIYLVCLWFRHENKLSALVGSSRATLAVSLCVSLFLSLWMLKRYIVQFTMFSKFVLSLPVTLKLAYEIHL